MQGEPVTLMAPQEVPALKAWGDVTGDLLKRLDMKVDFAAVDAGTLFARSVQESPPGQGGWQMHVNAIDGVDFVDPSSHLVRADGNGLGNSWANSPQIEAQIAAWYNATSLDEAKTIVRQLNRLAVDHGVYAPLGVLLLHHARRRDVSGIAPAPLPLEQDLIIYDGPALQIRRRERSPG